MKIALKPNFWLATPNVFLDSLVLSGRQLCVLTCVVLITSFAKVYQAYCLKM